VSRDIKELGLLKIPLKGGAGGAFKYVEPTDGPAYTSRLHRVVSEVVVQARSSLNQIVLRTHPGTAMMLAAAIDGAAWPEVLGTIGGDDTVLVICEKPETTPMIKQRFEDMRAERSA
jgi:transcriptional regulator of arginine metabolism